MMGGTAKVSKLRKWRQQHNLRLVDVADLVGFYVFKVHRLETGHTRPRPLDRVKIARALGVRVRDLFE